MFWKNEEEIYQKKKKKPNKTKLSFFFGLKFLYVNYESSFLNHEFKK